MNPHDIARQDWVAARARSSAVGRDWLVSVERLALVDAFDGVAASSLPIARDRALALLADAGWATRLLAPLGVALAVDPLFEPPIRVSRRRGRTGLLLFDAPAARVTANVASASMLAGERATSVIVPGHVAVTRYVRAGGARLRRWRADDDGAHVHEIAPLFPQDGDVAVHDGRHEGHVLTGATGDVVTLTVMIHADATPFVRDYALADGSLLRTASTDDGASRTAMLLTLLRVSARDDAPEVFDAATRDPAPHARWSAMREWLAVAAGAALPRLGEMARDDADAEVRATARATLAMVERRRTPCPA